MNYFVSMYYPKKLVYPLIVAWIVGLWSCDSPKSSDKQSTIVDTTSQLASSLQDRIVFHDGILPLPQQQSFKEVVAAYEKKFNCRFPSIVVTEWEYISDTRNRQYAYWERVVVPCYSSSDTIFFPQGFSFSNVELMHISAHELFHMLKPLAGTYAREAIKLSSWSTLVWYHWLVFVLQRGADQEKFNSFEDAVAEYFASQLVPDFVPSDVWYVNLGLLIGKMTKQWWITEGDLIQAIKTNNYPNNIFDNIFLNGVTWEKMDAVMHIFDSVLARELSVDKAFNAIANLRSK